MYDEIDGIGAHSGEYISHFTLTIIRIHLLIQS